ncbi:MAG TPA: efflux RND transporter periplasmic adaptor subunit [Tepidisphaeraceae bacterium]|nr:efflux RND transporter periplasmic adaptor subunit [Tepidisphaeraceae bacterium]
MSSSVRQAVVVLLAAWAGWIGAFVWPAATASAAQAAETVIIDTCFTAPSAEHKISFNYPGIVKQVPIKEGQMVQAGQVLLRQDDEVERHEYEKSRLEAESTARLDAAKADYEVKKKVYERKKNAGGGFTVAEIEEAELDVVFRENQIKVAEVDRQSAGIEAKKQAARLERMELRSPIDGIVRKIGVREGEFAEPDREKPAVVIVRNDPAWIDLKELKTWQVAKLKLGDTIEVRYPDEQTWRQAKIVLIDPVALPGTENQLVRLELPNPENRATGLRIQVKVPPHLLAGTGEPTAASR